MSTEALRDLEAFCRKPEPRIRRDTGYIHFAISAVNQDQPNLIELANLPQGFMRAFCKTFSENSSSLSKKNEHYIPLGDNVHSYQFTYDNKHISLFKIKDQDIISLQKRRKEFSKITAGHVKTFSKEDREFWNQAYVTFTREDMHKLHKIVLSTCAALDLVMAPGTDVKMITARNVSSQDNAKPDRINMPRERFLAVSKLKEWLPEITRMPRGDALSPGSN